MCTGSTPHEAEVRPVALMKEQECRSLGSHFLSAGILSRRLHGGARLHLKKVSMRVHAAVSTRDTYAVLFSNPMRARACQVKTQSRLGADNSQATEAVDNGHMQGFFSGIVT